MHFSVEASATEVRAWSEARLQFQPQGWQLEYRQALRTALDGLQPRPEQGLVATYDAPDEAFVDMENVLLYNVGTAVFTPLTSAGISCRQGRSTDKHHRVYYRLTESIPDPGKDRLIGTVVTDLSRPLPKTAGHWWAILRRSAVRAQPPAQRVDGFTVDVTLTGPEAPQLRMASLVKSLLDGLISSFHVHDASQESLLRERMQALGLPANSWSMLMDETTNSLGRRPLVRPGRIGIAWNPADDRCQAFRVRAQQSAHWTLTAQLRQITAAGCTTST